MSVTVVAMIVVVVTVARCSCCRGLIQVRTDITCVIQVHGGRSGGEYGIGPVQVSHAFSCLAIVVRADRRGIEAHGFILLVAVRRIAQLRCGSPKVSRAAGCGKDRKGGSSESGESRSQKSEHDGWFWCFEHLNLR